MKKLLLLRFGYGSLQNCNLKNILIYGTTIIIINDFYMELSWLKEGLGTGSYE